MDSDLSQLRALGLFREDLSLAVVHWFRACRGLGNLSSSTQLCCITLAVLLVAVVKYMHSSGFERGQVCQMPLLEEVAMLVC